MLELVLRLRPLAPDGQPERHVVDLAGLARTPAPPTATPLARWSATVADAHDACLVLDAHGRVLSLSQSAGQLLGCGTVGMVGRPLLSVAEMVDFDTGAPAPDYAPRVAPLTVLAEGTGLARSMLRVRHLDGAVLTLDAAATPLHDGQGRLIGSLTFFSRLGG